MLKNLKSLNIYDIIKNMRKFYTNLNLDCESIIIEEDYNHIVNVLRKKVGDNLILFNNSGIDYNFEITKINKKNIELKFISKKENFKDNFAKISVFQALIKNDKLELIVQKLTELNIDNLFLFESEFTIVKTKEAKLDKLNRISIEACKQCERSKSLNIENVGNFNNLLEKLKDYDIVVFAYEKSVKSLKEIFKTKDLKRNVSIIIGPEGGFSEKEKELLINKENVREVSISKNILRAETASIMLSSILMYELN